MEKLSQWLKANRVTQRALADHIGVAASAITNAKSGHKRFSLVAAARIELATGGAVKCLELVNPSDIEGFGRLK